MPTPRRVAEGKSNHELAQRLLRAAHNVREEIASLRNPLPIGSEIQRITKEGIEEGKQLNNTQLYSRTASTIYNNRRQTLQDACIDLEAVSLEAETLWGEAVRENLKPLNQCIAKFFKYLQMQLQILQNPPHSPSKVSALEMDEIIYSWPDNANDNPFSNEIKEAIRKIENFVKPHLKM